MPTMRDYASLKELDVPFGENLGNTEHFERLGLWLQYDYMVEIWYTGELDDRGWGLLAYRLCWLDQDRARELAVANDGEPDTLNHQVWEIIFTGEDYSPGAAQGDDDLTLANLLGFLGARPMDTDADYFEDYTPRQLEFAEEHGEELSIWSADLEGELE